MTEPVFARPKEKAVFDPDGFYRAKRMTAAFYMERLLPQSGALFAALGGDARALLEFDAQQF